MDQAHRARATADNVIITTTLNGTIYRFKRPAEEQAAAPSCSSSDLDGLGVTSRYAGGGGGSGVFGRMLNYRGNRGAPPTQPQWDSYTRYGPSSSGDHMPWAAELRMGRDRRSLGGADDDARGDSGTSGAREDTKGGDRVIPPAGWVVQSPSGERSFYQYPLMPTPTSAKRMRLPASGDVDEGVASSVGGLPVPMPGPVAATGLSRGYQHGATASWAASPSPSASFVGQCGRPTGLLPAKTQASPQGRGVGGYGRASFLVGATAATGTGVVDASSPSGGVRDPTIPSDAASSPAAASEAGGTETAARPGTSWSLEPGERSREEETASEAGASGVSPVGRGRGQWSGAGNRSGGAGAYPRFHRDREVFFQAHGRHRNSPPQDHQDRPHQSPQLQGRQLQDRRSQQREAFLPTGTILVPTRLPRGGSDPNAYNAALREKRHSPSASGSVLPRYRLPGLRGAVAAVEPNQSAGGGASVFFGEAVAESAVLAGGGVGGGPANADADVAARERRIKQQRPSEDGSMQPLAARRCAGAGCDRRPRFALMGSKTPTFCTRHRSAGMMDTRHPQCQEQECIRQPSFGMEGDRRALYCAGHKKEGMINVLGRRCQQVGCSRHPNFGFPGDRRSSFCKQHREIGMEDIVSRRCKAPSCTRRRLYNVKGLRPIFCSRHKLAGMMDVVSTRCQEPGCLCHPSFGYVSDMKARRCAKHRLENMQSVKSHRKKGPREATPAGTAATTDKTSHPVPPSLASPSPSSVRPISFASAARIPAPASSGDFLSPGSAPRSPSEKGGVKPGAPGAVRLADQTAAPLPVGDLFSDSASAQDEVDAELARSLAEDERADARVAAHVRVYSPTGLRYAWAAVEGAKEEYRVVDREALTADLHQQAVVGKGEKSVAALAAAVAAKRRELEPLEYKAATQAAGLAEKKRLKDETLEEGKRARAVASITLTQSESVLSHMELEAASVAASSEN
eukprot:g14239.t1